MGRAKPKNPSNKNWGSVSDGFSARVKAVTALLQADQEGDGVKAEGRRSAAELAGDWENSPLAQHVSGQVLAALGDAEAALVPLLRARDLAPGDLGIAVTVANTYAAAGEQIDLAAEECERALRLDDRVLVDPRLHAVVADPGKLLAKDKEERISIAKQQLREFLAGLGINKSWNDARDSFRARVKAVIGDLRAARKGAELKATELSRDAAKLAEVWPDSPLALHVSGHVRAALGEAEAALEHLLRAKDLAAGDLDIAFTLAKTYAGREQFDLAAEECERALRLGDVDLVEPGLHAVVVDPGKLLTKDKEVQISIVKQRLRELLADAWSKMAVPKARERWNDMEEEKRSSFLTMSFEGMKGPYLESAKPSEQCQMRYLTVAVDFVKDTGEWISCLCPQCKMVFLSADFLSHVEDDEISQAQELKESLSFVPDKISLDLGELQMLGTYLGLRIPGSRAVDAEQDTSDAVQYAFLQSLCVDKNVLRIADGSSNQDALFSWLSRPSRQDPVTSWSNMRQACLDKGTHVLNKLDITATALIEKVKLKRDTIEMDKPESYLRTKAKEDVEIMQLHAEVDKLKKKLVEVCTCDYREIILPAMKDYLWAALNGRTPVKVLQEDDKKGANGTPEGVDSTVSEELPGHNKANLESGSELHEADDKTDKVLQSQENLESSPRANENTLGSSENTSVGKDNSTSSPCDYSGSITGSANISSNEVTGTAHPNRDDELTLFATLLSLWHLKLFRDKYKKKAHLYPHFGVSGGDCMLCHVYHTFSAFTDKNAVKATTYLKSLSTSMIKFLKLTNVPSKEETNFALKFTEIIFNMVHASETAIRLSSDGKEGVQYKTTRFSHCPDNVCLSHSLFGMNKNAEEITYFLNLGASELQNIEMKSFAEVIKSVNKQFYCNAESNVHNRPSRFFTTAFVYPSENDVSGLLSSIAVPLDVSPVYEGLHSECNYSMVSADIDLSTKDFNSWGEVLEEYSPSHLRPQIIFFERIDKEAGKGATRRTNRDWSDCDDAFREEADMAIVARMERGGEHGLWLATLLAHNYPDSSLAHTILAAWYIDHFNSLEDAEDWARIHLENAARLAPRCPQIAMLLIDVLISRGFFDKAAEVRDRALRVEDPTDPALNCPILSHNVAGIIGSSSIEVRIAHRRSIIRGPRAKIEKGMGAASPPESSFVMKGAPGSALLKRAGDRWNRKSEQERRDFMKVNYGEMVTYCCSRRLPEQHKRRLISMLSDARMFLYKGWSPYWICPFCPGSIYEDFMDFKKHIDKAHEVELLQSFCTSSIYLDVEDSERLMYEDHIKKGKELLTLVPERMSDSEKELLKSWSWEPTDGEDLAERTEILSKIKEVVFELIDLEVISLNLLYIMHKFIMNRVKPVAPSVVFMCGSCGIGQLSSTHLQDLYDLLKRLTLTRRGCKHQKRYHDEQERQQDSPIEITWSQDTLSFDCGKIASRETDGLSQSDELFACLLSQNWLEDPMESCFCMWNNGPDILNRMIRALSKLKLKCSSCEELKGIQGGVYFRHKDIFKREINIKPYFEAAIGSAQVEMLLIDSEVEYWKKRFLETCKVDYLAVISPIAKACLWERLIYTPGDALIACPQNSHELHVPLDAIFLSLWHIRRFRDDLQKIPCICTDVIASVYHIILLRIFHSLDHVKECKTCDPSYSVIPMVDSLRSFVIDEQAGNITADRVVKSILERLHMAQTPLHFEFKGEPSGPQTSIVPSFVGCICPAHNLFGLHIEKKCKCVNEIPTKTESTFFHCINLGAVEGAKLESFSELLKAVNNQLLCDPKIGGCGDRIVQYLSYPPHMFMIVFRGRNNKGSCINMHEVLISLAAKLDISHIYEGLQSESMYNLVSAVCCDGEGQYRCFARDEARWLIYGSKTVKSAESWEKLIDGYSQANLRPEILCFEHEKDK
uniref:DUF629 domain-containing protein n=1 Tax=Leersia perrieri TaxID=77586 RepID=A0A0D9XTU4_9ORYZ